MPIFNVLNYQNILALATGEPDKQVDLSGLEQTFLLNLLAGIPWTESQACHAIWTDKGSLTASAKDAAAALIDGTIHKLMMGHINIIGEETMKIAIVRDQKTQNLNGGTFASGAWRQRDLNQKNDPDGLVSVANNSITIGVTGKYLIHATAPAHQVYYHQLRLVLNGNPLVLGTSEYCTGFVQVRASVMWVGGLVAGDVLRLEHQCSNTYNDTGFGVGGLSPFGEEVFSVVEIVQF